MNQIKSQQLVARLLEYGFAPDYAPAGGEDDPWRKGDYMPVNLGKMDFSANRPGGLPASPEAETRPRCADCGATFPDAGATKCPFCGKPLASEPEAAMPAAAATVPPEAKSDRWKWKPSATESVRRMVAQS